MYGPLVRFEHPSMQRLAPFVPNEVNPRFRYFASFNAVKFVKSLTIAYLLVVVNDCQLSLS